MTALSLPKPVANVLGLNCTSTVVVSPAMSVVSTMFPTTQSSSSSETAIDTSLIVSSSSPLFLIVNCCTVDGPLPTRRLANASVTAVSYTHLRAHETPEQLV